MTMDVYRCDDCQAIILMAFDEDFDQDELDEKRAGHELRQHLMDASALETT